MLLNIIDFIAGAFGVLLVCIVAVIVFVVLLFWLISSASDSELREKFGENYEVAISTE